MAIIIFLHGYSGGPGNYFGLDNILAEKTGLEVYSPYLPGHGTHVKYLAPLEFNDFYEYTYMFLKEHNHEDIILVGFSMGAQLALILSTQFPIKKMILFSVPFKIRFPYNILPIPWFLESTILEKPEDQKKVGTGYKHVPAKGLRIIKQGNTIVKKCARKIRCPILYIQGTRDPGICKGNVQKLQQYLDNTKIELVHIDKAFDPHNVLSPKPKPKIVDTIVEFIQRESE